MKKLIEKFLYRATCVLQSYKHIFNSEKVTVQFVREYLKQIKLPKNKRIAIATESLFGVYQQIPLAFSSLVQMQDLILPIFREIKNLKVSLPQSFRKAVENKQGLESYGFDKETTNRIYTYWNNNGRYIRSLRTIDQHYDTLIDQTYFEYINDPGSVVVVLPDNPETQDPKSFTFIRDQDACETIINGIIALNGLLEKFLAENKYPKQPHDNSISLEHLGVLKSDEECTLGLLISSTRTAEIKEKNALDTIEVMQKPKDGTEMVEISVRKLKIDRESQDT